VTLKETDYLVDLGADGTIILKMDNKLLFGRGWSDSFN